MNSSDSQDDQAVIEAFLNDAARCTAERIHELGLSNDTLLDPEAEIEQQVALLRHRFLEAERSCLPFSRSAGQFWKVLQARLQPIVLAYHGYATHLASLAPQSKQLRQDNMLQTYRQRLANSQRLHTMLFDMQDQLRSQDAAGAVSQALNGAGSAPEAAVAPGHQDQMTQNILASLEKQLQSAEKLAASQARELNEYQSMMEKMQQSLDDAAARYEKLKQQVEPATGEVTHTKPAAQQASPMQVPADQEQRQRIENLERELATAEDSAYNSYMMATDLGIMNRFLQSCHRLKGTEQLAQHLVAALREFGLTAVVGVYFEQGYRFWPEDANAAALAQVLEQHLGAKETIQKPHLMMFAADCCLLVENPPREDTERYDRLQGYFEAALQALQARLEARRREGSIQRQKQQMDALVVRGDEALHKFEAQVRQQRENVAALLATADADIIASLDITPDDPRTPLLSQHMVLLEEKVLQNFTCDQLLEPAYRRNVAKIAQLLRTKNGKGKVES